MAVERPGRNLSLLRKSINTNAGKSLASKASTSGGDHPFSGFLFVARLIAQITPLDNDRNLIIDSITIAILWSMAVII
ncbi:hypothetical protein ABI_08300 [Asticcacaulis biprosthecium C19]|uniref:Uncharacterized protein n=1 Tax=Asticcacaulis biprosthecium C19 TaxID=715226 RepID=F4QLX5_9CAUL|nr:hypothetical protein ABI_08300 [Asticcacaulis biprosthecium C19]